MKNTVANSNINKTAYWAVYKNKTALYQGSFTDCWQYLLDNYSYATLSELRDNNIKIARLN